MKGIEPLIFDIARGSFVDGPGVRTAVFFKGCPLSCPWCHNPESQDYKKETIFFADDCIQCGNCAAGKSCHTMARREIGEEYSPEHLISTILEDRVYYETSGGGVTFTGGEALSFIDYLSDVIPELKKQGIHVAIQTSGYFNFKHFEEKLLSIIDLIYFDIKIMNDREHQRILGKSNQVILQNFSSLQEKGMPLIPRIPLIPRYVATRENLASIARFFKSHGVQHCEFLYYNPSSYEKRIMMNRGIDETLPREPVPVSENQYWIEYFKQCFCGA